MTLGVEITNIHYFSLRFSLQHSTQKKEQLQADSVILFNTELHVAKKQQKAIRFKYSLFDHFCAFDLAA